MGVVGEAELVAVRILCLNVHEVVQRDQVRLVVHEQDARLDVLDVRAVVVNILGWRAAIGEDVIVVAVVDDEDPAWLDHPTEVFETFLKVNTLTLIAS